MGWTKFPFYELGQQERGQGCIRYKCEPHAPKPTNQNEIPHERQKQKWEIEEDTLQTRLKYQCILQHSFMFFALLLTWIFVFLLQLCTSIAEQSMYHRKRWPKSSCQMCER